MATEPHTGCWWQITVQPPDPDLSPADQWLMRRIAAEARAIQLLDALRNAAEARVGWRQQARDLLHLIDHGILPNVTSNKRTDEYS
jgi:hypothetical protein